MSIDETLKDNLIADVENICDTNLRPQTKEALKRCFEITIGHHYASQSREAVSDSDILKWMNNQDSSQWHGSPSYGWVCAFNKALKDGKIKSPEGEKGNNQCMSCINANMKADLTDINNPVKVFYCDKNHVAEKRVTMIENFHCGDYKQHFNQRILNEYLMGWRSDKALNVNK